MISDKDIESKCGVDRINRRDLLKYSAGSLAAFSSVGQVAGRRRAGSDRRSHSDKKEKAEALLQELRNADNKQAYYDSLSKEEKELVREALQPVKLGPAWTETDQTISAQGMETTYTETHHVTAENRLGQEIIQYDHELKWTVDREAGEVTSMNVSTGGSGDLFWRYSHDIDPEEKTIGSDGCHSTKSGLFQYCNGHKIKQINFGYDYCARELNTRLTSAISGFPNGRSSTSENKDIHCGTDCY